MPMMFVDELGFTTSEWLQVWAVFFFTTIFSNVFWGVLAEKMGWMKVVRWFGCVGMALSSLAFYYMPHHFGPLCYGADTCGGTGDLCCCIRTDGSRFPGTGTET